MKLVTLLRASHGVVRLRSVRPAYAQQVRRTRPLSRLGHGADSRELLANSNLFVFSAGQSVQVDGLGTLVGLVKSLPLKPVPSRGMRPLTVKRANSGTASTGGSMLASFHFRRFPPRRSVLP